MIYVDIFYCMGLVPHLLWVIVYYLCVAGNLWLLMRLRPCGSFFFYYLLAVVSLEKWLQSLCTNLIWHILMAIHFHEKFLGTARHKKRGLQYPWNFDYLVVGLKHIFLGHVDLPFCLAVCNLFYHVLLVFFMQPYSCTYYCIVIIAFDFIQSWPVYPPICMIVCAILRLAYLLGFCKPNIIYGTL